MRTGKKRENGDPVFAPAQRTSDCKFEVRGPTSMGASTQLRAFMPGFRSVQPGFARAFASELGPISSSSWSPRLFRKNNKVVDAPFRSTTSWRETSV